MDSFPHLHPLSSLRLASVKDSIELVEQSEELRHIHSYLWRIPKAIRHLKDNGWPSVVLEHRYSVLFKN
jgi:hypothetical protein